MKDHLAPVFLSAGGVYALAGVLLLSSISSFIMRMSIFRIMGAMGRTIGPSLILENFLLLVLGS